MKMSKVRIYNDEEIEILLDNPNVVSIKNKMQIKYKDDFKIKAVETKLKYPEKTAREIFEENGFDMDIIDDRTPQKRLCSWQKKYKMYGKDYFDNDKKYSYQALGKKTQNKENCILIIKDGVLVVKKIEAQNENLNGKSR